MKNYARRENCDRRVLVNLGPEILFLMLLSVVLPQHNFVGHKREIWLNRVRFTNIKSYQWSYHNIILLCIREKSDSLITSLAYFSEAFCIVIKYVRIFFKFCMLHNYTDICGSPHPHPHWQKYAEFRIVSIRITLLKSASKSAWLCKNLH